jgi:hypothetical protein
MKLRLFFGYARTIAFSAKNGGFRKAEVDSSVEFESESADAADTAAEKIKLP